MNSPEINKKYTIIALNNLHKYTQEYLTALHDIEKNKNTLDYEPYYVKIDELSNKITNELNIKNQEELDKFLSLIRISMRLLRKSIDNKDLETLEVSFYTLEDNIELLTKKDKIIGQ